MQQTDENAIKIENYLEDMMTGDEQEAFMLELSNNKELRQQYEDALLVRALLGDDTEADSSSDDLFFQPADEHIDMIAAVLASKKKPPVVELFYKYRSVAAVLALAVAGTAIYLAAKHVGKAGQGGANNGIVKNGPQQIDSSNKKQAVPGNNDTAVTNKATDIAKNGKLPADTANKKNGLVITKNAGPDTVAKITTPPNQPPVVTASNKVDDIEAKYFAAYQADDNYDPPELQGLLKDYQKRRFKAVISADEKAYQSKGADNRDDVLKQFLLLYKGLSYLGDKKPAEAIAAFAQVLNTANSSDAQYYAAQWYQVLAYLRVGDQEKAKKLLQTIANGNSPHKADATKLINELAKN